MSTYRAGWADTAKFWLKKASASLVAIGLVVGLYAFLARKESHRGVNGTIQNKGGLWASSLAAGDCFNATGKDGEAITSVIAMPCGEPHTAQVYGKYAVTGVAIDHPDAGAVHDAGATGCAQIEKDAVDEGSLPPGSSFTMLVPQNTSWVSGDRTVACVVEASANWTGSVLKRTRPSTATSTG